MNPALNYLQETRHILQRLEETQLGVLEQAADICSASIAGGGLVHLFGTGHSRIPVEEMFPRHGSFPGFHPIIELSLTNHSGVVGANGQRQAMFLEHVEGFAGIILRNFVLRKPDSFIIYSNSGVNEVVVDMALEVRRRGLPVIGVVSVQHCLASPANHSSGKRLSDLVDVLIDNCTPAGDALVRIERLADPVGPGSSIGAVAVTNMLKCLVAEKLTRLGQPPLVLTSACLIGFEASRRRFEACYDDYRARIRRVYSE